MNSIIGKDGIPLSIPGKYIIKKSSKSNKFKLNSDFALNDNENIINLIRETLSKSNEIITEE